MSAQFVIGIDLGTTNSVLAYSALNEERPQVQLLAIPQLVAANKIDKAQKLSRTAFKVPIIGEKPLESQLITLLVVATIFAVLALLALGYDRVKAGHGAAYNNITSQMQYHTQRLAKAGGLAARNGTERRGPRPGRDPEAHP